MKLRKNLVLTGMMGVGKSTIGKSLADKLSFKFKDIDLVLRHKEIELIQLPYNFLDNRSRRDNIIKKAKNQNIDHTETVDIAPTILNLLDIKTNHVFDGKVLPVQ